MERGDAQATDALLPLVYEELRLLAAQRLSRETPGQTLEATALVHEAYIRLLGGDSQSWNSRAHFFGAAAEAMRRILIENARRKKSLKHGGDRERVGLTQANPIAAAPSVDLLALDEALEKLSRVEPAMADLVKLRYFAGLTIDQIAEVQGISRRAVVDHWAYARSWLAREVSLGSDTSPG
jgi:RNA polymerase sigma factor (TIGR02999 family)